MQPAGPAAERPWPVSPGVLARAVEDFLHVAAGAAAPAPCSCAFLHHCHSQLRMIAYAGVWQG